MPHQERGAAPAPRSRYWIPFSVLWCCHTGTFFAFSASMPFLTLYVQEIGVEDRAVAAAWAGAIGAVSMILFAVAGAWAVVVLGRAAPATGSG